MATRTRKATRRNKLVYEPVVTLPPLRWEDFEALKSDIAVHGVLQTIHADCVKYRSLYDSEGM